MSLVWFPLSKFVQCVKIFFNPRKNVRNSILQIKPVQCYYFKVVKPTLVMSFLFGISAKDEKKTNQNAAEEVLHNVALATIALKDGNVEKSGLMLLKTLDFAETSNFTVGVISTCELLSSLAIKLGDYERAENLLNKALENLRSEGIPDDDNYAISFNLKLSRIYSNRGDDELAELNYKKCLKMQENKLKDDANEETYLLWSSILYWYGKFLLAKSRFKEAKSCFKDCFLTSLKVNELLPNQIMVILYNLGEVCEVLGEHDEAMEHLLKGVSLDKKRKNPDLTYFYSKLGAISMCKGLYKEAKEWCNQAQKFAVKYQNGDAMKESNECLEKLNSVFVS